MTAAEPQPVSVIDADRQLNELVLAGRLRQAYERWYDDNVVMDENGQFATKGKAANRDRLEAMGRVIRTYDRRLISSAVEGNRSFSEWEFDEEYAGIRFTLRQVAVREWRNGKIVSERFYYHADWGSRPSPAR